MSGYELKLWMKVIDSANGAGEITSFTQRGFPRVNDIAVAWCETEDLLFDPYDVALKHKANRATLPDVEKLNGQQPDKDS